MGVPHALICNRESTFTLHELSDLWVGSCLKSRNFSFLRKCTTFLLPTLGATTRTGQRFRRCSILFQGSRGGTSVFIRNFLETQIIPVDGVILLAGVYKINSARHWVNLEVDMARKHNKPVIGVPAIGEATVADEVKSLCEAIVGWDATALIATLDEIRSLRKESGVA